jgi:Uma2 family endonuclease
VSRLEDTRGEGEADESLAPDVSGLITEDDTPVDNVFSEKQMRLLTEPLHSSWTPPDGGRYFLAANVGVFAMAVNDPLVPDVFLSLDTAPMRPFDEKKGRSYLVWEHGKPPDVVIEIVSNREGDELTRKLRGYERIRVAHYVVFDPWHNLSEATLTHFRLDGDTLVEVEGHFRLPRIDLGLTLWPGTFEGEAGEWLRWCRTDGTIIPSGSERADEERQRAERLAAKLRELGIDPE